MAQRPRIRFAHKIIFLGLSLILLTGGLLFAAHTLQFHRTLEHSERGQCFTVYLATVNYLGAHFTSKRNHFIASGLDTVFGEYFLRGIRGPSEIMRPLSVTIRDEGGVVIYSFPKDHTPDLDVRVAPGELPGFLAQRDDAVGVWRVAGPLSERGRILGTVSITLPSRMRQELRAHYLRSGLALVAVCLVAMLLSTLFSRRVLAPISALTQAADRIRVGDFSHRAVVQGHDEIALLAGTFNGMIDTVGRRLDLLRHLHAWTMRLNQPGPADALYERITAMLEELAGAGFVRLYRDVPGKGLLLAHARGVPGRHNRTGMAKLAFDKGRAHFLGVDGVVREDPCDARELALPLELGERRLGALHLGTRSGGRVYDEETRATLGALAQAAASAMENASLRLAEAEQIRMQQEIQMARDIQRALMPRAMVRIPGYDVAAVNEPALEVGGDWYDQVESAAGCWDLLVGDVSGKGLPAALIVSAARALVRAFAAGPRTLAETMMVVNRRLSPDLADDHFVTLAAVRIESETSDVTLVRAGHEPVLHLRREGPPEWIMPEGSAFGLLQVDQFEEGLGTVSVTLQPGDALVLYTDGLSETRNPEGEEFGHDRIADSVASLAGQPAETIVHRLLESARSFRGKGPPQDDITILALRRTPATTAAG